MSGCVSCILLPEISEIIIRIVPPRTLYILALTSYRLHIMTMRFICASFKNEKPLKRKEYSNIALLTLRNNCLHSILYAHKINERMLIKDENVVNQLAYFYSYDKNEYFIGIKI